MELAADAAACSPNTGNPRGGDRSAFDLDLILDLRGI